VLDGPEGHHAASVRRLRVGEELVLADGRGGRVRCGVEAVERDTLRLAVRERTLVPAAAAAGGRGPGAW